jgi:hypothetical protein
MQPDIHRRRVVGGVAGVVQVPAPGSCAPPGCCRGRASFMRSTIEWRQSSFSFDWPASLSMIAATSTVSFGAEDGAADDAGGVAADFAPCAAGAPAVPDPVAAGFAADPPGAGRCSRLKSQICRTAEAVIGLFGKNGRARCAPAAPNAATREILARRCTRSLCLSLH